MAAPVMTTTTVTSSSTMFSCQRGRLRVLTVGHFSGGVIKTSARAYTLQLHHDQDKNALLKKMPRTKQETFV